MEKKRWLMILGVVVAGLSLSLLAAACGGNSDDGDGNGNGAPTATEPAAVATGGGEVTVDVSQTEWALDLSEDSVPSGTVTFNVMNDGTILHNIRLAKTDLAADELPVDSSTFTVKEDGLDIRLTGADLDVGLSEDLVVGLEPGHYVLFCNIPSHYEAGVHADFTVE